MPDRLLSRHLTGLGTTVFAEMSALAARTGSVNLGQGFPDVDGPPAVAEAAIRAIREGRGNQYPPGTGIPELRTGIADHQRRFHGIQLDPDTEVLVTTGATEAIAAALLALIEPGDEVILFEPYYDSYAAMVTMAGGVRAPVTLNAPDFRIDVEALVAVVTPRTRLIIVNSPHNPTGAALTAAEREAIAQVARDHDLLVLADEVYEHLTFDGVVHVPIATLPGMAERTLTLGSAGKMFSFTGWKIGWATGPAALVAAVRTVKQYLTYVSGGPFQYAVAEAFTLPDSVHIDLRESLQERRDLLCAGLQSLGMTVFRPEGTYFAMTDVATLGWDDGAQFCRELPERAGVVAIPASAFYDRPERGRTLVRWAFCKRPEVLLEALERMERAGVAR